MWLLKLLIQFVLAWMPCGEPLNHLLQHLKGSHSRRRLHARLPSVISALVSAGPAKIEGSTVVEIGTGWTGIVPVALYMLGAGRIVTYDHVAHLREKRVRAVLDEVSASLDQIAKLTPIPAPVLADRLAKVSSAKDLTALLRSMNIDYRAPADAAQTGLPEGSVDVVCSYAVLEHVPESLIGELAVETRRILKPGGLAIHYIGLFDHHHKCGVHFLQIPAKWWAFFGQNRISYHNRLRERQFVEIFRSYGGSVSVVSHTTNPTDLLALGTMTIDPSFAGFTHEELAISTSLLSVAF